MLTSKQLPLQQPLLLSPDARLLLLKGCPYSEPILLQ
jgi:hypothetical protein